MNRPNQNNKKIHKQPIKSEILNLEEDELKFKKFIINTSVNELYSQTVFIIEALNHLEKHMDLNFSLPILPNSIMVSFEAEIGSKKIKSKVYSKEKSEEKFVDSVSSGNNAFLSTLNEIKSKKYIKLSLGNIEPKQGFKLFIHTVEMNQSEDKSIKLNFSNLKLPKFPKINFKKDVYIDIQININTASPITRLISTSHPKTQFNIAKNNKEATLNVNTKNDLNNKDLVILFRTNDLSEPMVYEEKNNSTDTFTYSICQMFDNYKNISTKTNDIDIDPNTVYVDKYDKNEINDYPGNFYFLIDQSGSMSGNPMEIAKEALILFLKSLPEKSKYNIIGFGSRFIKYHSDLMDYNGVNLQKSLEIIKSLGATLGGTVIDTPLSSIYYDNKDTIDKEVPSHIFLLTDGAVSDKEKVISLVAENSENYAVTSIGIGSNVDIDLIKRTGLVGKGGHRLAVDVSDLKKIVIDALNGCLKPFMTNIKVLLPELISNNLICSYQKSEKFIKQDQIFNYSFISREKIDKSTVLTLMYKDYSLDDIIKKEIKLDKLVSTEGDVLSKIVSGLFLTKKSLDDDESTKIALNFKVMSDYTNLFAEIESEKEIKDKISVDIIAVKPQSKKHSVIKAIPANNMQRSKCIKQNFCNSYYNSNSNLNKGLGIKLESKKDLGSHKKTKKQRIIRNETETMPSCTNKESDDYEDNEDNDFYEGYIENEGEEKLDSTVKEKLIPLKELKEKEIKSSPKIYSSTKVPKLSTKSDLKENINYDSINEELFMYIIESQTFDGFWTKNVESVYKKIIGKHYSQKIMKFKEYIKSIYNESMGNEEIIESTLFTMFLLEKEYNQKYDEFKLIINKSKKALNKKGISNQVIEEAYSTLK